MDHKETLYARFISGELSEQEVKALKQSGEWEELELITKSASELKLPVYDKAASYEKLQQSIRANNKVKTIIPKRSPGFKILAIAASLLLLLGAFLTFSNNSIQVVAEKGENKTHVTKDGSTIRLNAGSKITYTQGILKQERRFNLEGEAFFEVTKGKPFKVNTINGSVSVLGTSFNVKAWGRKMFVECYSGRVKAESQGMESVLSAQESIVFLKNRKNPIKQIKHKGPLWSQGTNKYEEEYAHFVLEDIGRQFNIEMINKSHEQLFTGMFKHDSLEDALNAVCIPLGLKWELSRDKKQVYISN